MGVRYLLPTYLFIVNYISQSFYPVQVLWSFLSLLCPFVACSCWQTSLLNPTVSPLRLWIWLQEEHTFRPTGFTLNSWVSTSSVFLMRPRIMSTFPVRSPSCENPKCSLAEGAKSWGLSADVWRRTGLSGLVCYWHLVRRDQGCSETFCSAQNSHPPQEITGPQMLIVT